MATFGPPSFSWDGGVNSLSQREAVQAFYLLLSVDSGPVGLGVTITAGQNSQVSGYQIIASNTYITNVASGGAAVLPETSTPNSLIGMVATITNTSNTILTVFPNPGDASSTINGGPSVSVPAGESMLFHCFAPGVWIVDAPSVGQPLVSPILIGGALSSSTLTLESTSAVGSTDFINFLTGSQVERMRIDTNGSVNLGNAAGGGTGAIIADVFTVNPGFQVNGTGGGGLDGSINIGKWQADSTAPYISFTKSRSTTVGSITASSTVNVNDGLGYITADGYDASGTPLLKEAVTLVMEADAAPVAGHVPGRLRITTSSATANNIERMRIDSNGFTTLGGFANTQIDSTNSLLQATAGTFKWGLSNLGYNGHEVSIAFAVTAGASPTAQSLVATNQDLGEILFYGSDGTAFQRAAGLVVGVDGTPASNSMPGALFFKTTPSGSVTLAERMRIDSTGIVNIGNQGAAITTVFGDIPALQISTIQQPLDLRRYINAVFGPYIALTKSRGATIGSNVTVQSGDALGQIFFCGYDATGTPVNRSAGDISCFVDGAPFAGGVPSRLTFGTGGASGDQERMRIDSTGRLFLGRDNNAYGVVPNGGGLNPSVVIAGLTYGGSELAMANFQASANDANFVFLKSRAGTVQSAAGTAVANNDGVMEMNFSASDGTNWIGAAFHQVAIDGAVAANSVPMRFVWFTGVTGGGTERLRINNAGSVMQSMAALATSATDGFLYINSCAGAPTGVPTAAPGAAVPFVFDTTNSKIWVRTGGAWKGVVVA